MQFNSLQFLVFYIIVTSLYFNMPHKFRWVMLLAASCYFYLGFYPFYLIVMFGIIIISYIVGISLSVQSNKIKRIFLYLGILSVTGSLAVFKYYDPLNDIIVKFMFTGTNLPLPINRILLPVGLSFHTFQVISYMVEVYRGNFKPERNFGIYSLYVLFFPQLVAGPIERPQNLLPQFRIKHEFDINNFKTGILLMAYGYFKKVVITDRIAMIVDNSYNSALGQTGSELLIATLFYSIQIYFDFSAYTDIAIGSARIMGFRLTENFNSPYFSKSIADFWTRWHISLSTWLRDYLFLPTAYKMLRITKQKIFKIKPEVWSYVVATLFTMFICGLWHGDTMAFVAWGLIHGIYLVLSFIKKRMMKKYKLRTGRGLTTQIFSIFSTFLLVSFAWIFFRAGDISAAYLIIQKIFSYSIFNIPRFPLNYAEIIFSVLLITLVLVKEKLWPAPEIRSNLKFSLVILILMFACYFFGVFEQKQFIYFQF